MQILAFMGAFLFEFLGVFIDYDVEPCVGDWNSTALIEFAASLMSTLSANHGKVVCHVFLGSNMCRRYLSCPVDRCPLVPSRDPLHLLSPPTVFTGSLKLVSGFTFVSD